MVAGALLLLKRGRLLGLQLRGPLSRLRQPSECLPLPFLPRGLHGPPVSLLRPCAMA